MPKLHVIDGTPAPDTPVERVRAKLRKTAKAELLQCHRCGGREVIQTKVAMTYQAGRAKGGTVQILCAACFMKGERVVLV